MNETVKDMWLSYARAVLPLGASDVQRQEMRRAFYAGAWSILQATKALGDEAVSEDEGVTTLEAWQAEMMRFHRDVLEGRA